MRRLIAIFFLAAFLFNIGGYYIVFWGLHLKSDKELIGLIDTANYAGSDEVTITVPLNLPYPIYQEGFTRVNGEFEYDGEFYKLVKQKVVDDVLVLVCIKDHKAKKINATMKDFANAANNLPSSNRQSTNLLAKLFKDYQSVSSLLLTGQNGWSRVIGLGSLTVPSYDAELTINIPPPKVS